MQLTKLSLKNLRNFHSVSIDLDPHGFNLFLGKNGSGKTSLLEAIHILSVGRSFRSSDIQQVINHQADELVIHAQVLDDTGRKISMGISRSRSGHNRVKLDGNTAKMTELAQILPVRTICPLESSDLINGGPRKRREFLDWGVFHVKHHYWETMKRFNRVLKQRNAALKMKCSDKELVLWNQQFCELSEEVDTQRKAYLLVWKQCLIELIKHINALEGLELEYCSGWEGPNPLAEILNANKAKERMAGYGLYGPHRGDLVLSVGGNPAKELLSRGQQKLCAVAMYLAQGLTLKQLTGQHPLYLIDDFTSELDQDSQALLVSILEAHKPQAIITSLTEVEAFSNISSKMVESGQIQKMIEKIPCSSSL